MKDVEQIGAAIRKVARQCGLLFLATAMAPAGAQQPPRQPMIGALTDLLAAYEYEAVDHWRKVRISSASEWAAKRSDIRRRVLDIMGKFPEATPPLDARILAEVETPLYVRRKITYTSNDGERIPAWLLAPKAALEGKRRFPAILALHQTEARGKDSVAGLDGAPHVRYGHELAERGFVVLAPDSITAGERVLPGAKPFVTAPFDREHPEWSAMGKMRADHRRGLDYLQTLDFVDPKRIGAIGHSLGGYNAFFLAAFDARVQAVVSSCGFTPLGKASKPFAWSRPDWFVHFPRLAPYLRAGIAPFDFPEVLALIAPRPLFNYSASRDAIFPDVDAITEAAEQVRQVYRLLGAGDRFLFLMGDGPHGFPEPVRNQAYTWLEKQLAQGVNQ